MPYQWHPSFPKASQLELWPHRSLARGGFAVFIVATALMLAVPLLMTLGSFVLWFVLPYAALVIASIWIALRKSYRNAQIIEHLSLSPIEMTLIRHGPGAQRQEWHANPHWVRPVVYKSGGPVPHYITLQGGPREVEIGAFLSEAERKTLYSELQIVLADIRQAKGF